MTKQRKRPTVGDECWMVEWCAKLAFYEDSTDVDRDSCKMAIRSFATKEEAVKFSAEIWQSVAQHTFGIVDYWPSRFVPYDEADAARYPHVGFWEATADAETYEGD